MPADATKPSSPAIRLISATLDAHVRIIEI